jgi:uncharacterized membrane protein AbrB (regulator of aidB expression)
MPKPGTLKHALLSVVIFSSVGVDSGASDRLSACALTVVGSAIAATTANETASDLTVIDFINTFLK